MKLPTPGRWWPRRERVRTSCAVVALRAAEPGSGAPLQLDFVRVDAGAGDGAPRITRQGHGSITQLAVWQASGVFRDATLVLMLDAGQRQMLVLDQPDVPEPEQRDALRWPVSAALDVPAESVLFDATPLPPLNDSGKRQVLAAAATLRTVQPVLDALAQAGLRPDAMDVADMAQRNAVLLQSATAQKAAQMVLGVSGGELLVGLVAAGELCVARNMPLPAQTAADHDGAALTERLVLHVQRTVDLFERQITRFAIGGALATASDFSPATLEALRQVLPGGLKEIALSDIAALDPALKANGANAPTDATAVRLAALAALRCKAPAVAQAPMERAA